MHEWAAKVDEYARGLLGPPGSTLFEELGLYYIGPVDGHNIEDLICVLKEVSSLDSSGPVLVHVITREDQVVEVERDQTPEVSNPLQEGISLLVLISLIAFYGAYSKFTMHAPFLGFFLFLFLYFFFLEIPILNYICRYKGKLNFMV